MAKEPTEINWLSVIGRCLAFLCLEQAKRAEAQKYKDVQSKVNFLKALGLPKDDAAYAAGSTPASVAELARLKTKNKGGKGRGKKKSAPR
jgi:hypothetical protein